MEKQARYQAKPARANKDRNRQIPFDRKSPIQAVTKAKLELARPEDQAVVQAAMPRVLDLFQTYLREMRPDELRGTAGTYRLREELVARSSIAAQPAHVLNVLFTELLVQ